MTTQDKHHETRRAYKALETFIDDNGPTIRGSGFDTMETQGAYEALAWVKAYVVSLELQIGRLTDKADKYQGAYDYLVDKGRIDEDTGNVVS